MATGRLIKRAVDAVLPEAKDVYLWDSDLAGFGLKVTPAGKKVYLVQYRLGGRAGRVRRVTIGQHGSPWTVDAARREAQGILGDVAKGIDVAEARRLQKHIDASAPTMAELSARFLSEHADAKRKPRTASEYRRLFLKLILPVMGDMRVADVSRQDVARFHHARRGTPGSANRAVSLLSKFFNLAEVWGYRPDGSNPCRHIEKYPERKRERFLSAVELARLGEALEGYSGSPYVVAAIKLLIFTGARLGEILGLRWEWIDLECGEVRLPDSKTGAKILHLPPPAVTVLQGIRRLEENPHVIVGGVPGAALVNLEKPWCAIRKVAGLEDVRLHDLRHSFASVAVSSGLGLPMIGKILGHTQVTTTARYAHLASDPVKAAAAMVADKISDAIGLKK